MSKQSAQKYIWLLITVLGVIFIAGVIAIEMLKAIYPYEK